MIINKIQHLFGKEKRNIVFYFDTDGSLKEELPAISSAGIKVVEIEQNYFELKYKLEFEWKDQLVFLYHPFAKPTDAKLRKYPLLDLLKANTELKLDDASEFLSDYHLSDQHLSLVKKYFKHLKTKTNQKKLSGILNPTHFKDDNLKRGLISIALDFNTVANKNACMAKWLYMATGEESFIKVNKALKELELDTILLNWFNVLLDTKKNELTIDVAKDFACKIKYNVITAFVDKPIKGDNYTKLKLDRTADINLLLSFFQDWANHPSLKNDIETVFNILGEDIKIPLLMEVYSTQKEFGHYSEEMLSTIIKNLYKEVSKNPVKTKDDCIKWMRSSNLSEDHLLQISFIYHTSGLYSILDSYRSFKFNIAEDFIREYTQELYKIDFNFRKAVIAFNKVRDRLFEFEEEATIVFNLLNQKYDRFLIELNVEWQQLLFEKDFNYNKLTIDKQYDFYNKNLRGFENKIVVIISDALRYELGYELFNDLLADSKNKISIEPCLASIPSYTNLGMANLLPNNGISIEKGESDLIFKIKDKSTVSTNRASILQMAEPESTTIDFSKLKKMSKENKRAFFKDYRITYVYHDWIDAIGDKKRTEYETFEATTKAIEDIKWMIKNISGEMSIANVFVTSDHGFLFNHKELSESSRESLPKTKGYSRDHVRFVVGEEFEGKVDGYLMNIKNTTNIDTDLKVVVPRAINRFHKQGNIGVQFVHGGASLQELLIPVIKFYKQKKETQHSVNFKRIDQILKISSGSIRVSLLQDQPVSNDFKSTEVVLGLYSDTGELFSNELTINFNSTSANPKERVFEALLLLNTSGSQASFCFLKAFNKDDKNRLNPININDLIKISSLIEKDF